MNLRRPETDKSGVLSADKIQHLLDETCIRSERPIEPDQVQPASLDLTLGARAWRVRASFLPSVQRRVLDRLEDGLLMHPIDLSTGAVFERGCVYLVELNESLALPEHIEAVANPKSSTGRIDVFVRLVSDYSASFDRLSPGYEGALYAEVCPRTFSILARQGSKLNQLRFKSGQYPIPDHELEEIHAATPLSQCNDVDIENGLGVRVQISGASGEHIGWRARRHAGLIDVDVPGSLDPFDYFEPIKTPHDGMLILDPDEFYILVSREALTIPPHLAAEMTPISPGLGEFRVHYAGFFDPGFGIEEPSRGVLEVRSHDAPFVLEDGQLVARLVYERMQDVPQTTYGSSLASNYQGQGLKLSKHFKA